MGSGLSAGWCWNYWKLASIPKTYFTTCTSRKQTVNIPKWMWSLPQKRYYCVWGKRLYRMDFWQWTTEILDAISTYGKEKHRFYNPVKQNAGHIQAIRQNLPHNPGIPIYSVIVFFGNREFKDITCNADNTFIYCYQIKSIVNKKSCSTFVYSMAESCFVILSPCQKIDSW